MKNILLLILILGASACNEAKLDKFATKNVSLKKRNANAFSALVDYSSHPDTFTLFFLPIEATMPKQATTLYSPDATYESKLTEIMRNVVILSDKYDAVDKEIFPLSKELARIEQERTDSMCDFDDTVDPCPQLQLDLDAVNAQMNPLTETKSAYLLGIQKSLDDDVTSPVNWQLYGGDAKAYEFDINEKTKEVKILMPKLGPYDNRYSTKDGDIINVVYKSSDYDSEVKLLFFTLIEKGADKQPTGNYYEFKLEKSNFLDKVRFKGDVFKKRFSDGREVTRGTCKFELPPK